MSAMLNIQLTPIISLGFAGLGLIALLIYFAALNYLSLSFQVFAFENISAENVIKRSWSLVEGNFWRYFF